MLNRAGLFSPGLGLFAASWLLTEHFGPWLSFHSELLAFVAIAVLIYERLLKPSQQVSFPFISVGILMVVIIPCLQWIAGLSFFAGDVILSVMYLFGLCISIVVGYTFVKSPEIPGDDLKSLMLALLVPSLLSAGVGWVQWFSVTGVFSTLIAPGEMGRAIGNLAQPNHLATLLLMGLVAYAYLYKEKIFGTPSFVLGVSFLSIALAMTQSRTGLLGALVIALFSGFKRDRIAPGVSVLVLTIWVGMIFAVSRLLPVLSNALLLTSNAAPRALGNSSGRMEIWQQMLHAIWESPWWGYGWNQTFTGQTVGALAYPGELNYTYAHNVILDLMVWNGIPLGLLIVCAIGFWLVSRMIIVKNVGGVFAMAALLPVVVHSLLEFPFAYAYFLFGAGLLIGVVEASVPVARVWEIRKVWIAAMSGVWIVIGLAVAYEYVQIEEDYRIVRFENLKIGATPNSYDIPDIHLMTHMGAMLKAARLSIEPDMPADQIELMRQVALRFPYGLLSYKYAVAMALNGDAVGASKHMAVLGAVFGAKYYEESKAAFRQLEKGKYPQLNAVVTR